MNHRLQAGCFLTIQWLLIEQSGPREFSGRDSCCLTVGLLTPPRGVFRDSACTETKGDYGGPLLKFWLGGTAGGRNLIYSLIL
jgi:hypothetical protein